MEIYYKNDDHMVRCHSNAFAIKAVPMEKANISSIRGICFCLQKKISFQLNSRRLL
jgi:hypothetical protein